MHDVHDIVVGDNAHEVVFIVHNRKGHKIVVAELACHVTLVRIVENADDALPGDSISQDGSGPCQHKVAQRQHPDQLVLLIHHIAVIGVFLVFLHLMADVADGLVHCPGVFQHDDFNIHDAGSRVRGEVQKVAQLFRIFLGQASQQGVAVPLVQFVQNVGGIVGIHLGNDLGGIIGVQVFQDVNSHIFIQFCQGLCRVFPVHAPQGADLGLQVQVFQVIRKVGRVHVGGFCSRILAFLAD